MADSTEQPATGSTEFTGGVGIDLGTTYSCVGIYKDDRIEIIANDQGNRTTPSFVAFTDDERLIGDSARNQAAMNAKNTVFDAKRLIGRRFDEQVVKDDIANFTFEVVDQKGAPAIKVNFKGEDHTFSPQEISAMVLTKMKEVAETRLEHEVKNAVITVPAYFNDAQRAATKDAGTIAGLEVLRIINEPTAAAIAFGLDQQSEAEKNVLIFDLGGGTFDVSLLNINKGTFTVKATDGDTHLGGEDFDHMLLKHCQADFKKKFGHDITSDARAQRRLRSACERAKRTLSSVVSTTIEVDSLYQDQDFSINIKRALFEELNKELFAKLMKPVENVLSMGKMLPKQVDEVVLVGGSTRIPKVQSLVEQYFGKDANKKINPDEAVAYGAAVQAAIMTGMNSDKTANIILLDVTPFTLGIALKDDVMGAVVKRGTAIPALEKKTFTTVENNQTQVVFAVYEGERYSATDNRLLGEFELSGIPPMLAGKAQLDVTFELDANSLLKVSAQERDSGRAAEITITGQVGMMSAEEKEHAKAEFEKNEAADKAKKAQIESKQRVEELTKAVESCLQTNPTATARKQPLRNALERALGDAVEGLKRVELGGDATELGSAEAKLKRALNRFTTGK